MSRKLRIWLVVVVLFYVAYKAVEAYGNWGARQLECNHTQLPADALPGAGPLRIALISDLHNAQTHFETCVEHTAAAKPDLIVLAGDFIMVDERFRRTRWAVEGLRKLCRIAPVFAILGNQDYEKQEQVQRVYSTAGVTLLRNQSVDWRTPSGSHIRITGLGDWNEGDEAPAACMQPAGQGNAPVLLLSHDPESRWLLRSYSWNLMLSGHTHGGQIANPFTGDYISFRSSMPAGHFSFESGRHVFVSRGVGSTKGIRFFCNPEMNIIDILPAAAPAQEKGL